MTAYTASTSSDTARSPRVQRNPASVASIVRRLVTVALVGLAWLLPGAPQELAGQGAGGADVIARAATALGGRDRLLAIKTLTIEGYGQLAYQNGGGNITSSPDAPQ